MMQSSVDERVARLDEQGSWERTESNAFSDAVLGLWWGSVGGVGATLLLCCASGVMATWERGHAGLPEIVGWGMAVVVSSLLVGVGLGAVCGFVAAAVAHYGEGAAARTLGGGVGGVLPVAIAVAVVAVNDVSILLDPVIGQMLGSAIIVAIGAGLLAGAKVGREIGA